MKCDKCGSNLDIDTPFCPYCGAKNTVASKHREDMKRYDSDYKATKEEVISNSKKFNTKNFKITMIALTVAAIAAVILICALNETLAREFYYDRCRKETVKYVDEIKTLVKEQDYTAINNLARSKNLRIYSTKELEDYSRVAVISEAYTRLLSNVLVACTSDSISGSYSLSTMVSDVQNIVKYTSEATDNADVAAFYDAALRDTKAMLTELLDVPEEGVENLSTLSQANINLLIEEAYNAKIGK